MLKTRLCDFFGIEYPVLGAPMAFAAGGRLASAISQAGGLGLIGGAYGDADWIETAFSDAGNSVVGCGFITWHLHDALEKSPDLLDAVLARKPRALMLSFGNPAPLAARIAAYDVPLICQVQTLRDAKQALECGASVVVAQGGEAGGHGEKRGTMALVPEVADLIARKAPQTLLCAAGGIADGRGLAAALMLGADGVLVGSRFWASEEALVHPAMHAAAIGADGDDTIRSSVMDIARKLDWPDRYTARVLKNAFTARWHDDIEGLLQQAETEAVRWKAAWQAGDVGTANVFVGEAAGLIEDIQPAATILKSMVSQAQAQLRRYA